MKYFIFITTLIFAFNLLANEPEKNKENKKSHKEQKQEGKHRKRHGPRKAHPNHPTKEKRN
jgi:hypothetical protein